MTGSITAMERDTMYRKTAGQYREQPGAGRRYERRPEGTKRYERPSRGTGGYERQPGAGGQYERQPAQVRRYQYEGQSTRGYAEGRIDRRNNVIREDGRRQTARQENARRQNNGQRNRTEAGPRTTAAQKAMRERRRKRRRAIRLLKFAVGLALLFGILTVVKDGISLAAGGLPGMDEAGKAKQSIFAEEGTGQTDCADKYAEKLSELLEKNQETADYVKSYPDREQYMSQPVDLTQELQSGDVPLLMQWDKRWGYNAYGDNMIGLAGCGPVCLTMAYLHFTGDISMTPREMAAFADDNGYCVEEGTKWTLWTEGVGKLGLSGEELPLDQSVMERALDAGNLVVCSMGPGDFTTDGHFILIRGYDANGFYVNDPNRNSNSSRQWDFDTLRGQIRNLWALGR